MEFAVFPAFETTGFAGTLFGTRQNVVRPARQADGAERHGKMARSNPYAGFLFHCYSRALKTKRKDREPSRHRAPRTNGTTPFPTRSVGPLRRRASLAPPPGPTRTRPTAHRPTAVNRPPDQRNPRPTAASRGPAPRFLTSSTTTEGTALPPPSESAFPFGEPVYWGRARSPPTRERVPDENCFLVRRLTPETSGSEGREFPELGDSQPSRLISRELISTAPTATPPCATSRGRQSTVTNC